MTPRRLMTALAGLLLAGLSLAGLLLAGCGGAPAADAERPRVVPGSIDPARFLGKAAKAAEAAGAGPLEPVAAMVLSEGDQIGSFVQSSVESCLLVLARPGESVRDVDLFVYSEGGDRLSSDESPDAEATVLVCPPHPRRMYVAARVMTGAGMIALGVMAVPPPRADAVARAVGVRGRPGQDTGKLAAWPGLERKIRERRASLGSSWEDIRRLAMHVDPRAAAAVSVPIQARRCLDVLVTPSEEVPSIDATVVDEDGRVVALGRPPGRDRAFVLCSESERTLTVLVRPRLTSGLVAVVVGRSPPGAAAELSEHSWVDAVSAIVPLPQALEQHGKRLAELALGRARELGRASLRVGVPQSLVVKLEQGCTRIDAVAGKPLGRFTAALWSDAGRLLSRGRGGPVASMFYCGSAVSGRIELAAGERAGPVAVVAHRDAGAPQVLLDHPSAAARLLSRLEASAGPIGARAAGSARALRLEPGSRHVEPLDIPGERCVEIVAALDGAASGIELSLVDARGAERWAARGSEVAAQRVCAGSSGRKLELRLEARSAGGVLVLVRSMAGARG